MSDLESKYLAEELGYRVLRPYYGSDIHTRVDEGVRDVRVDMWTDWEYVGLSIGLLWFRGELTFHLHVLGWNLHVCAGSCS